MVGSPPFAIRPPVNGSVAVSGYRRSSGPAGPAAWYCTISWHHHSVWSARQKDVTLSRSSFPRTSQVACICPPVFRSRRSVTAIYTLLGGSPVLPTPKAHRHVVAPRSVPSSYCTISMAETGLGLGVMLGFPVFRKFSLPITLFFWFPLQVLIFFFCNCLAHS